MTDGIRIERGFSAMAQRGFESTLPPAKPPPRRRRNWRPWMTALCIVSGVAVLAGLAVSLSSCEKKPAPAAPAARVVQPVAIIPPPVVPMPPPPAAKPGPWRSQELVLGTNRVMNADFGQGAGSQLRNWTVSGRSTPETWTAQATNSPFTARFANNGRAACLAVPKSGTNAPTQVKATLERMMQNGTSHWERVLFSWDMRLTPGRDELTIGDQAGGNPMGFVCRLDAGTLSLNDLAISSTRIASNAWYHIELLVNYADGADGVEGSLYDASGIEVKRWVRLPQAAMKLRKQRATGADAVVIKTVPHGGGRELLLDNFYAGLVTARK